MKLLNIIFRALSWVFVLIVTAVIVLGLSLDWIVEKTTNKSLINL